MEYIIYEVKADEKLEDIAEKHRVSAEDIKKSNPNVRIFKSFWGVEVVGCLQQLKIPQKNASNTIVKIPKEDSLSFEKIARFRCEQTNITKVLDNITFSSTIKTQYLLSEAKEKLYKALHILLEDYIPQVNPNELEVSFELVKPIEFFKNNIKLILDTNGDIDKIINFKQIEREWIRFKKNELPNINFFNQIKAQKEEAARDFIKMGNIEFSNESKFKEVLYKNLFYHIFLKANRGEKIEGYTFSQISQLFPNQEITVKVNKTIVFEDENTIVFRLVGNLQKDKISVEELKKQYDEIYKPMLKYSFTDYDYIYRITYTLSKSTGVLLDGKVLLDEKIKNNFECITQFDIKQVEL